MELLNKRKKDTKNVLALSVLSILSWRYDERYI